jgi:hypothetical protein
MRQTNLNLFGASAGLGFRWWPTDSFALELSGRYAVRFNSGELPLTSSYTLKPGVDGPIIDVGLLWSGF